VRFVRICVILVLAFAVASCSDDGTDTATPRQMRGIAVETFACPRSPASSTAEPTSIVEPQALRLCPLDAPVVTARAVTVTRGEPGFEPLVDALSRPDEAPTTGACPEYADVPQVVLARTDDAVYAVAIPTDACGHYQSVVLDALRRAREPTSSGRSTTTAPVPSTTVSAANALTRFLRTQHPDAVVRSDPIDYGDTHVAFAGVEEGNRNRAIVVVAIAGDTVTEVARLELPFPAFEFATERPIQAADLTGDGRADALVAFAAADNEPGVVVSADGGAWRLVSQSDDPTAVYIGRDATIAGHRLQTTYNDCVPDCAQGRSSTVVWRYDREHGTFVPR
jgi:hypothetical protein